MAIAGTLAVNILARTDKFNKGIKSARKSLKGFGTQIAGIGKGVVGFGTTMVGVAGVAGFGAFAKSTITAATHLGDTADKLGIATDKLELMRFAAEATGVSQTALDTALQRMIRRVGEASRGFGSAAKTLQQLGLNAEELNRLKPDQMFQRIGAAVVRIPDKGGQLAAMMAVFDTEGVGLLNTAAAGVDSFVKAFEGAGGATSTKAVANAREFSLAVQEFKTAIGATGRDFVLGISPIALDAIRGLRILMEESGLIEKRQNAFDKLVGGPTKRSSFAPERLRQSIVRGLGEDIARVFSSSDPRGISRGRQRRDIGRLARGGETEALREFQDAARQRAKQIRRSSASLIVQKQMLRALQDQTGITLEPATFE